VAVAVEIGRFPVQSPWLARARAAHVCSTYCLTPQTLGQPRHTVLPRAVRLALLAQALAVAMAGLAGQAHSAAQLFPPSQLMAAAAAREVLPWPLLLIQVAALAF
jgi:hypothetical protein